MKIVAGIGSRKLQYYPVDQARVFQVAQLLAKRGWLLRSGGAEGADSVFESAFHSLGAPMEIFLPWNGFNGLFRDQRHIIPDFTEESENLMKHYHPKPDSLSGAAQKLMMRNGNQILGKDLDDPSDIVVCWTVSGKAEGGTAQAIRIAESLGVPVFNLRNRKDLNELLDFLA